jgi:membrane protein
MAKRRPTSRLALTVTLFKDAGIEWFRDNTLRLSAAVSFYAVLSLAPLLVIVIRVMGLAHARQFARQQIINVTTYLMGTQAADAVKPIIDGSATHAGGHFTTVISTIVLFFSTTSVFIELQNSMNSIWDVEIKARKTNVAEHVILTFIRARLLSMVMVFALGFLLVSTMFISGILTASQSRIADVHQWPAHLAAMAISGVVEFTLFAAIFKFLPNVPLRWRDVWHGALIAAFLFALGRFGLAIYFQYARAQNVYGAVGLLVAVLTWIYYSSFSLFFGAEFTKVWTRQFDPRHAKQSVATAGTSRSV